MNIIKEVTIRIEKYRLENKNPCKSYATQASAERAAEKIANQAKDFYPLDRIEYVVFFNEAWQRWNVAFRQPLKSGGYMGFFSDKGFFSY